MSTPKSLFIPQLFLGRGLSAIALKSNCCRVLLKGAAPGGYTVAVIVIYDTKGGWGVADGAGRDRVNPRVFVIGWPAVVEMEQAYHSPQVNIIYVMRSYIDCSV